MNIERIPIDADDVATSGPPPPPWAALTGFAARLAAISLGVPAEAIGAFKAVLEEAHGGLKARFAADEPVEHLVRDRARLVDLVLTRAWRLHTGAHAGELALVAVGGYGRGELHPCSDIDVMVLLPKSEGSPWQADLERFLTFLWDIGLEVGHSVRTIDDCQQESLADISVATTLLEARLLDGPE
ncbi:MAG: nucleotidyltransferase domain-containing protein, partial [Acidimicrobiales bacterium]